MICYFILNVYVSINKGSKMGRKPNSEKHIYTSNSKSSSENYENSSNDSSIKTSPSFCDRKNNNFNYNSNNSNNNNNSYEPEYKKVNSMKLPENKTTSLSLYKKDKNESPIDRIQTENENSIKSLINQIIKFTNHSEFQSTGAQNSFTLDERYQSKTFSIENLQALLQNSNLVINRYHNSLYPLNPQLDRTSYLILPLLRDKVYQAFIKTNTYVAYSYENALKLIKNDVKVFKGHDAEIKQIWNSLMDSITVNVKNFVTFAKQIPGLSELSTQDLNYIIDNRLFDYFMIKHAPLFINDESYMILPNGFQYSRYWLEKIVGKEMTSAMFEFSAELNALTLTPKETALLLAYLITVKGK